VQIALSEGGRKNRVVSQTRSINKSQKGTRHLLKKKKKILKIGGPVLILPEGLKKSTPITEKAKKTGSSKAGLTKVNK